MTTAWSKQSPGLYRATKRKGVAPSLQVDVQHGRQIQEVAQGGATRKNSLGVALQRGWVLGVVKPERRCVAPSPGASR